MSECEKYILGDMDCSVLNLDVRPVQLGVELNTTAISDFLVNLDKLDSVASEFLTQGMNGSQFRGYVSYWTDTVTAQKSLSNDDWQNLSQDTKNKFQAYKDLFESYQDMEEDSFTIAQRTREQLTETTSALNIAKNAVAAASLTDLPDDVKDFVFDGVRLSQLASKLLSEDALRQLRQQTAELRDKLDKNVFVKSDVLNSCDGVIAQVDGVLAFYSDSYSGFAYVKKGKKIFVGYLDKGTPDGKGYCEDADKIGSSDKNSPYRYYGYWSKGVKEGEGAVCDNAGNVSLGDWQNDRSFNGKLTLYTALSQRFYALPAEDETECFAIRRELKENNLVNYRNGELYNACNEHCRLADERISDRNKQKAREQASLNREKRLFAGNHVWASVHTLFCVCLTAVALYACRNWITLFTDAFGSPQLSNMYFMVFFAPFIATFHSCLMEVDASSGRRGMRAEQYVFSLLFIGLVVGSIFLYDMPIDTPKEKAFVSVYAILPCALALFCEFCFDFWASDNADDVKKSFRDRNTYTFRMRALFLVYITSFFGFVAGIGYALMYGMQYSIWHILWIAPAMQLVSGAMSSVSLKFSFDEDLYLDGDVARYHLHSTTELIKGVLAFAFVCCIAWITPEAVDYIVPTTFWKVLFLLLYLVVCAVMPVLAYIATPHDKY